MENKRDYCAYCAVVEVEQQQYLCDDCIDTLIDYLAQEYQETVLAAQGLY